MKPSPVPVYDRDTAYGPGQSPDHEGVERIAQRQYGRNIDG